MVRVQRSYGTAVLYNHVMCIPITCYQIFLQAISFKIDCRITSPFRTQHCFKHHKIQQSIIHIMWKRGVSKSIFKYHILKLNQSWNLMIKIQVSYQIQFCAVINTSIKTDECHHIFIICSLSNLFIGL